MAKRKPKDDDIDEDEDLEDEDDEDDDELEITERDYVMARLAAARAASQQAVTAIDESLHFFVIPEDDKSGKKRREMIDEALEAMGVATRSLEAAEEILPEVDMTEGEPWDDDEDDEDD